MLNETQHVLLAELLETGTLLEQFELVRGHRLERKGPACGMGPHLGWGGRGEHWMPRGPH